MVPLRHMTMTLYSKASVCARTLLIGLLSGLLIDTWSHSNRGSLGCCHHLTQALQSGINKELTLLHVLFDTTPSSPCSHIQLSKSEFVVPQNGPVALEKRISSVLSALCGTKARVSWQPTASEAHQLAVWDEEFSSALVDDCAEQGCPLDVLVVGAGPVGLLEAISAARLGVFPAVVEQRSAYSRSIW